MDRRQPGGGGHPWDNGPEGVLRSPVDHDVLPLSPETLRQKVFERVGDVDGSGASKSLSRCIVVLQSDADGTVHRMEVRLNVVVDIG